MKRPVGEWWRDSLKKWRAICEELDRPNSTKFPGDASMIRAMVIGRCGYCRKFQACPRCPLSSEGLCQNHPLRQGGLLDFWLVFGHVDAKSHGVLKSRFSLTMARECAHRILTFIEEDGKARGLKEEA